MSVSTLSSSKKLIELFVEGATQRVRTVQQLHATIAVLKNLQTKSGSKGSSSSSPTSSMIIEQSNMKKERSSRNSPIEIIDSDEDEGDIVGNLDEKTSLPLTTTTTTTKTTTTTTTPTRWNGNSPIEIIESEDDEDKEDESKKKKQTTASAYAYGRLKGEQWLDEKIIDDYLGLKSSEYNSDAETLGDGVVVVNTRVWLVVGAREKTGKDYVMAYDSRIIRPDILFHSKRAGTLILPIHLHENHWSFVEIDFHFHTIAYMDSRFRGFPKASSLPPASDVLSKDKTRKQKTREEEDAKKFAYLNADAEINEIFAKVLIWLENVWAMYARPYRLNPVFRVRKWKTSVRTDTPQQPLGNVHDCGIYMLGCIEHILAHRKKLRQNLRELHTDEDAEDAEDEEMFKWRTPRFLPDIFKDLPALRHTIFEFLNRSLK